MVSRLIALVIVLTLHIPKFPGSAGEEDHIFFKNVATEETCKPLKRYLLALLSEPVLHNTSYGSYKAILKSLCLSQLSQMEGRTDRTTFQTTWLGPFAKWHPTARLISVSSVLFTLFNCLTVPVYAVSLPILAASIKRPSFPSDKWAACEICQWPHCWMWSNKTWLSGFLQASLSHPGTEARSINT